MQNYIEDKFLKQKLDSISREKLYIDRELRRISLAKESLMESLDRYTAPPRFANKQLSLPCAIDGRRKDSNIKPISALRRYTLDSVQYFHAEAERNQKLKPLSCVHEPIPDLREGTLNSCRGRERTSHLEQTGGALRITSLDYQQDAEIRVASTVAASLIQSGKNRFTEDRPGLFSRQTSMYDTPLNLPKLPASPAKRELNPLIPRKISAGQAHPRDGMLATNLKSKFRQIGSVVMATAILRAAHEKTKEKTEKGR